MHQPVEPIGLLQSGRLAAQRNRKNCGFSIVRELTHTFDACTHSSKGHWQILDVLVAYQANQRSSDIVAFDETASRKSMRHAVRFRARQFIRSSRKDRVLP